MRKIFLDMDGVIVNLDACVIEKVGHPWNLPSDQMWDIIRKKAPNLFVDAKPLDDAKHLVKHLIKFAKKYQMKIEILTAVPSMVRFEYAPEQKQEWLKTHFPELTVYKFNIGPHAKDKHTHATPGDILIDDSDLNIGDWRRVGGFGIKHVSAQESLQDLDLIYHFGKNH